ncbi:flagellar biosynthetic protein FliO [Acidovorax sp. sic0104]|uniref:flagellar biosynthetic protein FliO n=1 Tax=Acidovorax sp. sic0104 TaxID=2854784 RepID=UPI00351D4CCA
MSLPKSIPLRREVPDAALGSGSEIAWLGLLIPIALVAVALLRTMKSRSRAMSDGGASAMPKPLRGWLHRSSSGGLQVRESRRLTPGHSVHEIEWRGRTLLIGCSSQSIHVLAETSTREHWAPDPCGKSAGDSA